MSRRPKGLPVTPALVHRFYNARQQQAVAARPNAAHKALAKLQNEWPGEVTLITQNVDDLHEAGRAQSVLHIHGILAGALCGACSHRWKAPPQMQVGEPCPNCTTPAGRPDVVWFGEMPYHMDAIFAHLVKADLFAAIGTSGQVYPAAAFVKDASAAGAHTVEINLEPSEVASNFSKTQFGPATETVPLWVDELRQRT